MQKQCEKCGIKAWYSERYDAYFCPLCNIWLEERCEDEHCIFCSERPEKPLIPFIEAAKKLGIDEDELENAPEPNLEDPDDDDVVDERVLDRILSLFMLRQQRHRKERN